MKTRFFTFFITLVMICQIKAQEPQAENTGLVKWLSIEEAEKLNQSNPRPLMIDAYTDWCGWCKHMMKTTFSNPGIAGYINAYFYPVRFNAETKDTIRFRGKVYVNKSSGNRPPHDLAIELLEGKLSYPTLVFFNNEYKFKLIVPGYLDVSQIEPILVYSLEYVFGTTGVQEFRELYHKAFFPDSNALAVKEPEWVSWKEAERIRNSSGLKTMVFVGSSWCNSGKVMQKTTLTDTTVLSYILHKFIPVLMDAQSRDTVVIAGIKYPPNADTSGIHPYLLQVMQGRFSVPNMLFLDSSGRFITSAPQFMTAGAMLPVLSYIGSDAYLNTKWDDFRTEYMNRKP